MPLSQVAAVLHPSIDDPNVATARKHAVRTLRSKRFAEGASARCKDLVVSLQGEKEVSLAAASDDPVSPPDTVVEFDGDSLVTTVKTTIEVPQEKIVWDVLVDCCNPLNWKVNSPTYFSKSDWLSDGPPPQGTDSWRGNLHERFDWHWNVNTDAMFDNDLYVDFQNNGEPARAGAPMLHCEYHLVSSNASRVWSAREYGGLDVDSGTVTITAEDGVLRIEATKSIRFTNPQLGPPDLGAMLNYMAPTTTGLWMQQALHQGIDRAIEKSAQRSEDHGE
jgi:hypothetical protein